jgi:GNAT superfamily N-acetyltransferase
MAIAAISPITNDYTSRLMELYRSAWWATTRTEADVEMVLEKTPVTIGLVDEATSDLVAFARILTDEVCFALILDVIVHPKRKGNGFGQRLMETVLSHPRVVTARSIELVCQPDLVPFYEKFGFTDRIGSSRLMRRTSDSNLVS